MAIEEAHSEGCWLPTVESLLLPLRASGPLGELRESALKEYRSYN